MPQIDPYSSTRVPAARSQVQIKELLTKYGHGTTRWTDYDTEDAIEKYGVDNEVVCLEFNTTVERNAGTVRLGVRVLVPIPDGPEPKTKNQIMRVLYWWLKAKLESVAFEFKTFEEEFLPYMVGPNDKTVFEVIGGNPITGQLGKLPSSNILALAAKTQKGTG